MRIERGGTFDLCAKTYTLERNDQTNALHGGRMGFHGCVFEACVEDQTLVMHYTSNDGEEGYPGTLYVNVKFHNEQNALHICYEALCDPDTIINLTNHTYFTFQGHGEGSVDDQYMNANCSLYAENEEHRLVSGVLATVENTPFDFRIAKKIG